MAAVPLQSMHHPRALGSVLPPTASQPPLPLPYPSHHPAPAGLHLDYPTFCQLYADIFTPIEPLIAQQQLLAASLPTFLLSNCSALHIDDCRQRYPFMRGFTGLCLSYEVRVAAQQLGGHRWCLALAPCFASALLLGCAPRLPPVATALVLQPQCRCRHRWRAGLQVCSFKPEPAIYEAAEQLAGCSGPDLVFIDDKQENAAAAAARGWRSIHHTSVAGTLRQLKELGLPVVVGA